MTLYEYPLNERIRTYLRLEHLLLRLRELIARSHSTDHHYAIQTLFELVEIGSRADLKFQLLKDIEQHQNRLEGYRHMPGISELVLHQCLNQLHVRHVALSADPSGVGDRLQENAFLQAIRQRSNIPCGTCSFDLPAYHEWLQRPAPSRQADLHDWSLELHSVSDAIFLLLRLLRESGLPQKMIASQGYLQCRLPAQRGFQLLRLQLGPSFGLIPEITGNCLLFSVRLLRQDSSKTLQTIAENMPVEVTLCA